MTNEQALRFFFVGMGIGFVISSIKVTICTTRDVGVMTSLYYTICYNFVVTIFSTAPFLIGMAFYQYFKNKKSKK
jgi:hypothetical protein